MDDTPQPYPPCVPLKTQCLTEITHYLASRPLDELMDLRISLHKACSDGKANQIARIVTILRQKQFTEPFCRALACELRRSVQVPQPTARPGLWPHPHHTVQTGEGRPQISVRQG